MLDHNKMESSDSIAVAAASAAKGREGAKLKVGGSQGCANTHITLVECYKSHYVCGRVCTV